MHTNIKKERLEHGMTISDVANNIGVHVNAVSRWESGKNEPKSSHLVALCKLFDVSPEYLLGLTDERHAALVAK